MKESEYITATNLARIQVARSIIGQITPDDNITKEELREITMRLEAIGDRLGEKIAVEE